MLAGPPTSPPTLCSGLWRVKWTPLAVGTCRERPKQGSAATRLPTPRAPTSVCRGRPNFNPSRLTPIPLSRTLNTITPRSNSWHRLTRPGANSLIHPLYGGYSCALIPPQIFGQASCQESHGMSSSCSHQGANPHQTVMHSNSLPRSGQDNHSTQCIHIGSTRRSDRGLAGTNNDSAV